MSSERAPSGKIESESHHGGVLCQGGNGQTQGHKRRPVSGGRSGWESNGNLPEAMHNRLMPKK